MQSRFGPAIDRRGCQKWAAENSGDEVEVKKIKREQGFEETRRGGHDGLCIITRGIRCRVFLEMSENGAGNRELQGRIYYVDDYRMNRNDCQMIV